MIREVAWQDVAYLVLAIRWTLLLTLLALGGGSVVGRDYEGQDRHACHRAEP